jgi:hypothetical protein
MESDVPAASLEVIPDDPLNPFTMLVDAVGFDNRRRAAAKRVIPANNKIFVPGL